MHQGYKDVLQQAGDVQAGVSGKGGKAQLACIVKPARVTIVTRGEEEQIQLECGKIDAVPAWRFC